MRTRSRSAAPRESIGGRSKTFRPLPASPGVPSPKPWHPARAGSLCRRSAPRGYHTASPPSTRRGACISSHPLCFTRQPQWRIIMPGPGRTARCGQNGGGRLRPPPPCLNPLAGSCAPCTPDSIDIRLATPAENPAKGVRGNHRSPGNAVRVLLANWHDCSLRALAPSAVGHGLRRAAIRPGTGAPPPGRQAGRPPGRPWPGVPRRVRSPRRRIPAPSWRSARP